MISNLLYGTDVVDNIFTPDELNQLPSNKPKVNIMMGQTFDQGQPADMLKYALLMKTLEDELTTEGLNSTITWLIADHFMFAINDDIAREDAKRQAQNRVNYLRLIDQTFGGRSNFIRSSDLSQTAKYRNTLEKLKREVQANPLFRAKMFLAVPEDRRSNPKSLDYPLEELATIESLDTNVKVGPRYEANYDLPARESAKVIGLNKFVAIHLKNSFPFGNPNLNTETAREIEQYGVLPYKITSKKLQKYRIDPTKDSDEQVKKLIMETEDTKSIADLITIGRLAARRLTGKDAEERITDNFIKNKNAALYLYERFISHPLKANIAT